MSYKDRFSEACKIADFAANPIAISGYDVWNVQCVQSGRHVDIDGPFFTEEEARISADLLRGSYRGVKAVSACHCAAWNPDPAREKAIRIQGLQSREMLARRLGICLPMPQEKV